MWAVFATAGVSLLTASGLLLVKKSNAFAYHWWAGVALILLTVPVDLLALGDTSSNILYPVGVSSTILFNQLLASPILQGKGLCRNEEGTPLPWSAYIGTTLLVGGVVLTTAFGDNTKIQYNQEELLNLFTEPAWAIAIGVMAAFFAAAWRICEDDPPLVHVCATAYIAAFFGTLQMIVFKCLGEMIQLQGNEPYDGYLYATFGVGALIFALLEILAIGGFERFEATVILPVYHVILLILVLILGSIFFKEDALKLEGFLPGVLLIFTGIYVLG